VLDQGVLDQGVLDQEETHWQDSTAPLEEPSPSGQI
jgi:hypothetical protein